MKTRTVLSLFIGLSFFATSVLAQQKGTMTNKQLAEQQTDQVKKNVDKITPDEINKILPVEEEFANNMQYARDKAKGDTIVMNKKAVKLCKIRDTKIKAVLTSQQYSQYLDMEKGFGCKLNCTKS
jgi:hypothetical protein